jgi:carboxyl-terminal processing protease
MVKMVLGAALFALACVQPPVVTPSRQPPPRREAPGTSPSSRAGVSPSEDRAPRPVRPGGYNIAELPLVSKVLFYARENYYDRERLVPQRMLRGALEFVQRDVPEFIVEFIPPSAPQRVVVTVSGESRSFGIDRVDAAWALRTKLQEIIRFAQPRLQPVSQEMEARRLLEIEMAAANGMLYTLDPHSVLLDQATYRGMRGTGAAVASIGVILDLDAQRRVRVRSVLPNAPAERAGLRPGDRIVRINDEPTANLTLQDALERLRGEVGSAVDLYVDRDGTRGQRKLRAERAFVVGASIDSGPRILTAPAGRVGPPAKIGYFHISHIVAGAADEVGRALGDFRLQHVAGIVIDLRGCPGGLYEQAVRVADAFIKKGTLASMVGVGARQRKDELAREDGSEPEVPVAVLVDRETASGAEIIAAALRNLNGALIVGEHTFGVGSVQVLFDVPSPIVSAGDPTASDKLGLKLTTAQFLTAGDVPLQLRGVTPDIELREVTSARLGERTLFWTQAPPPARAEATFEWALPPPVTPAAADHPAMALAYLGAPTAAGLSRSPGLTEDEPELPARGRFTGDDFAASFAAELLSRVLQPERAAMRAVASAFVTEVAAREDRRIVAAVAALGADWRGGARTSAPQLTFKIEPTNGGGVRAGSTVKLRGTVTNVGAIPAFRVSGVLDSNDPAFDRLEMPFGFVAPGSAKTFDLVVHISSTAATRSELVRAHLRDVVGVVPGAVAEATFDVQARPSPALSFTCRAVESGTAGAHLAHATPLKLAMRISNRGSVAAEQAEATLRRTTEASDDGVVVKVSRWSGAIAAGATADVSFTVNLPTEPRGGPVELELTLADAASEPISARVSISPPAQRDGTRPDAPWQLAPAIVMATPPVVTVRAPATASGASVHVAGEVSADTGARDVFIRVWNRAWKVPVRKVFYRSAPADTARLSFEADVPISPGSNLITVHGRDAQGIRAAETVVVLKKGDRPLP